MHERFERYLGNGQGLTWYVDYDGAPPPRSDAESIALTPFLAGQFPRERVEVLSLSAVGDTLQSIPAILDELPSLRALTIPSRLYREVVEREVALELEVIEVYDAGRLRHPPRAVLPNLKHLVAPSCSLLASFGAFPQLEAAHARYTPEFLEFLSSLKSLRVIGLLGTREGVDLAALSQVSNLRYLRLIGGSVRTLEQLVGTTISDLWLQDLAIDSVEPLARVPNLRHLSMVGCSVARPASFLSLRPDIRIANIASAIDGWRDLKQQLLNRGFAVS